MQGNSTYVYVVCIEKRKHMIDCYTMTNIVLQIMQMKASALMKLKLHHDLCGTYTGIALQPPNTYMNLDTHQFIHQM